jgi:uncharacterized Ntn-hydrolase superfamily protein
MTWSIIARDKSSGCFGIAVATKFFAVGARVPFIAAGVGAVATQALINPFYGTNGLRLLREGMAADAAVKTLIAADAGRDHRQVHVMDAHDRVAAHTGAACIDWNGHIHGDGFSIAGNMLAGPRVLDDSAAAYLANEALPFPRRLIAAMQAGEAAGGDKRGKQSAALLIYGEEDWSDLDLRVDDHAEPVEELARLERVSRERWTAFRPCLPSRRDPVGITDRAVIEREVARALAAASAQ